MVKEENKHYEFHDFFTKSCRYIDGVAKCEKKRISKKCVDNICENVNLDKIPQKKDILHEHYIFNKGQSGSGDDNASPIQKHKESVERVKNYRDQDHIKEKRENFIKDLIDEQKEKKYESLKDLMKEQKRERLKEKKKEYNKEYSARPETKQKRKDSWKKEVAAKSLLNLNNYAHQSGSGNALKSGIQKHEESVQRVKNYRDKDHIKEKREIFIKNLIDEKKQRQKENKKEYSREYFNRPDIKEKKKEYQKEYFNRPDIKEYMKEYYIRPEIKEKRKQSWKKEVAAKSLLKLHNVNSTDNRQNGGSGPQFDGKKSSIMIKVPTNVKKAAEKAFVLKKLGFKGGIETGWKRAKQLSTKSEISIKDLRYIRAWFARHIYTSYPSYKKWKNCNNPKDKIWHNKRGILAFILWGGTPAFNWVNSTKNINLLNKYYNKDYKKIKVPR